MKKSPLNILSKDGKLLSSAEGGAAYRKSALNMLGVSRKESPLNDMTEQENAALDAVEAMPDSDAVDLGSVNLTERGKKIAAIKKDVSDWDHDTNTPVMPQEHDYFVANPTEESDEMAVKIQDAKNITLAGGPFPEGITTKGQHYTRVEKRLQRELQRKMNK